MKPYIAPKPQQVLRLGLNSDRRQLTSLHLGYFSVDLSLKLKVSIFILTFLGYRCLLTIHDHTEVMINKKYPRLCVQITVEICGEKTQFVHI